MAPVDELWENNLESKCWNWRAILPKVTLTAKPFCSIAFCGILLSRSSFGLIPTSSRFCQAKSMPQPEKAQQMFGWERAWSLRFVETKTLTHWSDWSRPCILGPLLEASRRSNRTLDPFVCGLTCLASFCGMPGTCLIREIPIHSSSRIACAKKGASRSLWICPSRPGPSQDLQWFSCQLLRFSCLLF